MKMRRSVRGKGVSDRYIRCIPETCNLRPVPCNLYPATFYLCSMAEDLVIATGSKAAQYQSLIPQVKALMEGESDLMANLANVAAALKGQFGWWWIGFYIIKENELVVGPFQGPVACTRILKGHGVCGSAWEKAQTLIVPDVEKFPGHIACSSLSKSEIVVPVIRNNEVVGILDADSDAYNQFDATDQYYLEEIVRSIQWQECRKK